jgi:hypothetical protein
VKDSIQHLRDIVKDSTQSEGGLFHFLTRLTQKINYAHGYLFHFLMSLIEENNYARDHLFQFLMRLT